MTTPKPRMFEDGGSPEPGNYEAADRALDDFEEPLAPDHDGPCIALCEYKCDKWVAAHTQHWYDAADNRIHTAIGGIEVQ